MIEMAILHIDNYHYLLMNRDGQRHGNKHLVGAAIMHEAERSRALTTPVGGSTYWWIRVYMQRTMDCFAQKTAVTR
jgi:hypothetical protein